MPTIELSALPERLRQELYQTLGVPSTAEGHIEWHDQDTPAVILCEVWNLDQEPERPLRRYFLNDRPQRWHTAEELAGVLGSDNVRMTVVVYPDANRVLFEREITRPSKDYLDTGRMRILPAKTEKEVQNAYRFA